MNLRHAALFLPLVAMLCNSCNSSLLEQRVAEGVIEYALSFPDYDPNGLMAGMLPERSTLTFKEDKQVAELSAGMGVFRTSMVTNNSDQAMDYHLSLMSKKIVAHMAPSDLELFNPAANKPTILYTNAVDTIAGYPCRKAVAVFDAMDQVECELWYTDKIHIANPNWFGPFAEIPGVLLRYDVVQYGMRMRLTALSVTPSEVDPAKFTPKQEFEQVKPEVLHHELAEVLSTFSM
jgi:GLPGLI family protein